MSTVLIAAGMVERATMTEAEERTLLARGAPGRRAAAAELTRSLRPAPAGRAHEDPARPIWCPTPIWPPRRRSGECSPNAAPTTRWSVRRVGRGGGGDGALRWVVDPLDGTINLPVRDSPVRGQRRLRGRRRHGRRGRSRPESGTSVFAATRSAAGADLERSADHRLRAGRAVDGAGRDRFRLRRRVCAASQAAVVARLLPGRARHPPVRGGGARPRVGGVRDASTRSMSAD